MRITMAILLCAVLPGCINLTTKIAPDRQDVAEVREASDCVLMLFGIAIGTASYEQAVANPSAAKGTHAGSGSPRLQRVRGVAVSTYQFLGFGAHCVEVTGE